LLICERIGIPQDAYKKYLERPVGGSYLDDLDSHFNGKPPSNGGRAAERMILTLIRTLSSSDFDHGAEVSFLYSFLFRGLLPLHIYGGRSDRYMEEGTRIKGHDGAMRVILEELLYVKWQEPERDHKVRLVEQEDSGWIYFITSPLLDLWAS
jgi:hypothetical protein